MSLAQVHLLPELPRTATGKVRKGDLRSQAAAVAADGAAKPAAAATGPAQ